MAQGHGYEGMAVIVTAFISEALILSMDCVDPLPWTPAPTSHVLVSGAPDAEAHHTPPHLPGSRCWHFLDPGVQESHGSAVQSQEAGRKVVQPAQRHMLLGRPLCSQDL